jgi:hypothetical protein
MQYRTSNPILIASFVFACLLALVQAQNYGPNTCLMGWVWRQAIPSDDVCVTPETRSQTWYDNSQAPYRVNPNGGAYGPNTCLDGYVWREAVPNDYVCVVPATRTQAAYDNTQASIRVDSVNVWTTTWTSTGSTEQFVQVNGDHFNYGPTVVGIYDTQNNEPWVPPVTIDATSNPPNVAGSFSVKFNYKYCPPRSLAIPGAYAMACDLTSTRCSTWAYLYNEC